MEIKIMIENTQVKVLIRFNRCERLTGLSLMGEHCLQTHAINRLTTLVLYR